MLTGCMLTGCMLTGCIQDRGADVACVAFIRRPAAPLEVRLWAVLVGYVGAVVLSDGFAAALDAF